MGFNFCHNVRHVDYARDRVSVPRAGGFLAVGSVSRGHYQTHSKHGVRMGSNLVHANKIPQIYQIIVFPGERLPIKLTLRKRCTNTQASSHNAEVYGN